MDLNSLTDLLNAAAAGFEWNGTTYRAGDLTIGQRAEFERWLKDRAIAAAGVAPEGAPDDYMQPFRQGTVQDIAAGVYSWGSPACVRATCGRDGGTKVLHLLISARDESFTAADAEALWDAEFDRLTAVAAAELAKTPKRSRSHDRRRENRERLARAVADPPA